MQLKKLKPVLPHVIAILSFVILATVYFYPQVEGLSLRQSDNEQAVGMSKETADFRQKYGTEPLWTNGAFSGMPTYQISTVHKNYVTSVESNLIFKPLSQPIGYVVLAMIGFYILLLCFGANPWLSMIGAIAFGFSTINIIFLGAGHNSKVHAIALLPMVIGSILLAYRKNYIIGSLLLCFSLCLEVAANHLQITYYGAFLIALIIIVELIIHLKVKLFLKFLKVSSVLLVAAIISLLPSFSNLYTTYEYGKYSTRGKSELTISPSNPTQKQTQSDALESWYIKQYNMGTGEVWSLVIPNVKGGGEVYMGDPKKKNIMAKLSPDINPQIQEYIAQSPTYFGEQAGSGGAFYFGATIFILFILGLVFIKDPIKWAFLGASLLAIVLSWKNGVIIDFFIEHFPLFNKFRDTKGMLILAQISFPFIGILFLKELFDTQINKKKLLYVLLGINGLLLIFWMVPSAFFDFMSSSDAEQMTANQNNAAFNTYMAEIVNLRIAIFRLDALRSLFFAICVSVLVYVFVAGKLKKNYFLAGLGILVLIDLWAVDKRYVHNDEVGSGYKMWIAKQQYKNPYRASASDIFILNNELQNDPALKSKVDASVNKELNKLSPHKNIELEKEKLYFSELNFATDYRVFLLNGAFSNGEVSYFHKSLGGYNGAKLKKYQELVDFYITNEQNTIYNAFKDTTLTYEKIAYLLKNKIPVLNMLNTKYIIYNPGSAALPNPNAYGNCWFAKDVKLVQNADEEITSLGKVDLKTTAVVNQKYKGEIHQFQFDSTASIKLTSYLPNHLIYQSKSSKPQFAVFSEIYYPKGWDVYIDGKKSSYMCANYLLRAMDVPAGEHKIEFRFEPQSYMIGTKISTTSSILLIILLLGALSYEIYRKTKAGSLMQKSN
jgi:hypothetical protein